MPARNSQGQAPTPRRRSSQANHPLPSRQVEAQPGFSQPRQGQRVRGSGIKIGDELTVLHYACLFRGKATLRFRICSEDRSLGFVVLTAQHAGTHELFKNSYECMVPWIIFISASRHLPMVCINSLHHFKQRCANFRREISYYLVEACRSVTGPNSTGCRCRNCLIPCSLDLLPQS